MKESFLRKLKEWYSGSFGRYEVINETDTDVLVLVSYTNKDDSNIYYDVVRLFRLGKSVEISVDQSVCCGNANMDAIVDLIRAVIKGYSGKL